MNVGSLKSLLSDIWETLATNPQYSKFVDEKDVIFFKRRLRSEGITFLTTSLPSLGKRLDKYHSTLEWDPCPGYNTGLGIHPIFLGECLARAIEGNPEAVDCYRQLTLIFYKLEFDHDQELIDKFLDSFKATDANLPTEFEDSELLRKAKRLICKVLENADPQDITPCHGTGATACRSSNMEKWRKLRYFPKLDAVFSYPDFFFYSPTHLSDELSKLEEAPMASPRARVCLVPKDSRGPRVISCEPAELMYIQQGLMRKLYEVIENHDLTRGLINFESQEINRGIAEHASKTGVHATLDLSDASDRVSLALVRKIFPAVWVEAFEACRSEETILPTKEVVKLRKFAPMGSSCCFPVEALTFWAIATASIQIRIEAAGEDLDFALKNALVYPFKLRDVFVYGDDIICATSNYGTVVEALESVGLKVNTDKSYYQGHFRESCGGDYYKGKNVAPVRMKKVLTSSLRSVFTAVDLCNNFIAKFGEDDAYRLIYYLEKFVGTPFPRSSLGLPGTVKMQNTASNDVFFQRRWNKNLQRYEYKIPMPYITVLKSDDIAWSELLRRELTRDLPQTQEAYGNLYRKMEAAMLPGSYAVPRSARAKWGWSWLG